MSQVNILKNLNQYNQVNKFRILPIKLYKVIKLTVHFMINHKNLANNKIITKLFFLNKNYFQIKINLHENFSNVNIYDVFF